MRLLILIAALVTGLAACVSRGPNDVAPDALATDRLVLDARQARLAGAPPPIVGTGTIRAANGEISATGGSLPGQIAPAGGAPGGTDIAGLAGAAIAEAEAAGPAASGGGGVFDNLQPQLASDLLPPPLIPRVAAFALRTTHLPGERLWRRNPLRRDGGATCAQFENRDLAQDRFLAEGGPERDPLGLDRDGDGFVCGFDPRALRAEAAAPAAETFGALPPIDG